MKTMTLTTTAQQIAPAGDRDFLHIQNNSAGDIYLKYDGDADEVTAAAGVKLAAGEWLILNNDGTRRIFNKEVRGIMLAGTADIRVMGAE